MFDNKTLSEISTQDITQYRVTRGKNKDTNKRIKDMGDVMDILIEGAKKIPTVSSHESKEA